MDGQPAGRPAISRKIYIIYIRIYIHKYKYLIYIRIYVSKYISNISTNEKLISNSDTKFLQTEI